MSASASDATTAARRPVLLLMGDSLTERGTDPDKAGWVSLLAHRYERSADIVPRGLSGYNTKWFIEYASPVIERELSSGLSPSLITLWLGANDAALREHEAGGQHVPLANYSGNLKTIVGMLRAQAPDAHILLITPPHVDDAVRTTNSTDGKMDRSNDMAGEYARACVEVAQSLSTSVLDLHSFFNAMPESERNACLEDGLHFTARGNRLVDEQVRAKLSADFPELAVRLETWQLPNWHTLV